MLSGWAVVEVVAVAHDTTSTASMIKCMYGSHGMPPYTVRIPSTHAWINHAVKTINFAPESQQSYPESLKFNFEKEEENTASCTSLQ